MNHYASDLHFWHKNILNWSQRPFETIEDMNDGIIERLNNEVTGELWHLGDFTFSGINKAREIISKLEFQINLIKGNHDQERAMVKLAEEFSHVKYHGHYKEFRDSDRTKFVLCHFPFISWNEQHYGAIHLHGHTHGDLKDFGGKTMDVGFDNLLKLGYDTVSISHEQVREYMGTRDVVVHDGHKIRSE